IGETVDGRRLPESQSKPDRLLQADAAHRYGFVRQKRDKAAAAGMWPKVRMQQLAQGLFGAEGDLALANPLQDGIAPLPMSHQTEIPLRQLQRQIVLALFHYALIGGERWNHVFGIDYVGCPVQYFAHLRTIGGRLAVDQQ